jgi:hypothetical protein
VVVSPELMPAPVVLPPQLMRVPRSRKSIKSIDLHQQSQ